MSDYEELKKKVFKKKDEFEYMVNQIVEFDFPKAIHRYFLIYESFSASIEETYFWILNYLMYDMGMGEVEKINDLFSASEHSTFFGVAQQRMGLQQDKVAQYLGTIGKMIKDLFQIVRELRIIEERLEIYEGATQDKDKAKFDNSEVTLKGIYVDMAEGGAKSPASVFGLAQNLQYTTLPDLFFTIHIKNDKDIDDKIKSLQFNENVKWVLRRKLKSYLAWKKNTKKEMETRWDYQLKYLRQHYNVIKTYISWIKPYIKNIARLRGDQDKSDSANLISAFEGSMVEIEIIGKFLPYKNKKVYSCVNAHFVYRTMPQMNYQGEGYQRAPLHIGEIKMTLRSYAWTQKQIDDYKSVRQIEDLRLMAEVDKSLVDAMDALPELERYLEEAGEKNGPKREEKTKIKEEQPDLPGIFEPFQSLFGNLTDIIPKKDTQKEPDLGGEIKNATSDSYWKIWLTYKNYKKAHRMLTW